MFPLPHICRWGGAGLVKSPFVQWGWDHAVKRGWSQMGQMLSVKLEGSTPTFTVQSFIVNATPFRNSLTILPTLCCISCRALLVHRNMRVLDTFMSCTFLSIWSVNFGSALTLDVQSMSVVVSVMFIYVRSFWVATRKIWWHCKFSWLVVRVHDDVIADIITHSCLW